MEDKVIYLVYNGEVRTLEVLKDRPKSLLLDYNYVRTNLRKVEIDTVLERGLSPSYDAVFSFDKNKAIQIYNEHLQQCADKILLHQIEEEI